MHPRLGYGVVGQRTSLQQPQEVLLVDSAVDGLEEPGFDLILFAVLNSLEQVSMSAATSASVTEQKPSQPVVLCVGGMSSRASARAPF